MTEKQVPMLFSEVIQNRQVLDHPAIQQYQSVKELETDKELQLVISPQPDRVVSSDPNVVDTNDHVLAPLALRAAYREDSDSVRFISIHLNCKKPFFRTSVHNGLLSFMTLNSNQLKLNVL